MKTLWNDFKAFISKGDVMQLAVAFIIGAAFKDIVNSLVKDILTPVISLLVGDEGFSNYKYVITEADEALGIAENAIYWGNFIQSIFDFFIIAVVIFLFVRFVTKAKQALEKPQEAIEDKIEEVVQDVKPKVEDILLDIKDLLRFQKKDKDDLE
jgi:large conductance mechanosensitive channel